MASYFTMKSLEVSRCFAPRERQVDTTDANEILLDEVQLLLWRRQILYATFGGYCLLMIPPEQILVFVFAGRPGHIDEILQNKVVIGRERYIPHPFGSIRSNSRAEIILELSLTRTFAHTMAVDIEVGFSPFKSRCVGRKIVPWGEQVQLDVS